MAPIFVRSSELGFLAASHEDQKNPGAIKKVLFDSKLLPAGQLQMVNLAKIPAGKGFQAHFHQDMHEVFVMTRGNAKMRAASQEYFLAAGDAILIPPGCVHEMQALGESDVDYIVFGVSSGEGGKTIVVAEHSAGGTSS